jgi:hypothetical protein
MRIIGYWANYEIEGLSVKEFSVSKKHRRRKTSFIFRSKSRS